MISVMALVDETILRGNNSKTQSEIIRRLRLGNLRKLLRDRNGPILPDDDAGREYLMELLLPISVGPHADVKMPNTIAVWAPWMQQKEAQAIVDQINLTPVYHRKPDAKILGERLRVTNWERERLKLWTIAPCDMGSKGMNWWRKQKKRHRMRELRRLRGQKTRAEYLTIHNTSKEQPWAGLGISRATWYRQRETSPCQVKLTKAEHTPVSQQKRQVSKKEESAERNQLVSSIKPASQSQKAEMPVTDTARELLAPTCLNTDTELLAPTCVTTETGETALSIGHNGGPPMDAEQAASSAPAEDKLAVTPEQDLRGMPRDLSCYYGRPLVRQFDMAA
jgi:hypothetical protein